MTISRAPRLRSFNISCIIQRNQLCLLPKIVTRLKCQAESAPTIQALIRLPLGWYKIGHGNGDNDYGEERDGDDKDGQEEDGDDDEEDFGTNKRVPLGW